MNKKTGRFYAQYSDNGQVFRIPGSYATPYEAKVARDEVLKDLLEERYSDFPFTIEEANK